MAPTDQLALPIDPAPNYLAADYLEAASNAEARAWLARPDDWPGRRLVLFGDAGCGKTHLLRIWANRNDASWLNGPDVCEPPLAPVAAPLAIDDADRVTDEAALLHWLNAASEGGYPVLLTGRAPPVRWPARLPDLASRLRAAVAVGVAAPEDSLLRALLARQLSDRQLAVSETLQDFLLLRLPRTPAAVREAALRLDRAALMTGGPVTRRIASQVLAAFAVDG